MSEASWSKIPSLVIEILVAVLHSLTFLQLIEMVTNRHLCFRKPLIMFGLLGPGDCPLLGIQLVNVASKSCYK